MARSSSVNRNGGVHGSQGRGPRRPPRCAYAGFWLGPRGVVEERRGPGRITMWSTPPFCSDKMTSSAA
ncbi:hypothetical protein HMPREF1979_03002 [Actinomyces johnsonii F0542]|uniref:Uncharacterized protein n=1 Tax=Actinomyces johnsonii F0542 TaxID=1321818 RepID=U1RU35_9ACTO|nr:hypothetical protein HMPREF1979_03002 [Actinomyces johnsonii F0542]